MQNEDERATVPAGSLHGGQTVPAGSKHGGQDVIYLSANSRIFILIQNTSHVEMGVLGWEYLHCNSVPKWVKDPRNRQYGFIAERVFVVAPQPLTARFHVTDISINEGLQSYCFINDHNIVYRAILQETVRTPQEQEAFSELEESPIVHVRALEKNREGYYPYFTGRLERVYYYIPTWVYTYYI